MDSFAVNRYELPAGAVRLEVVGEVDMAVAADLATAQTREVDRPGLTGLVVDLHRVTFLDSTGIAALVTGMKAARQAGIAFAVANPHQMVRHVLEVTGLLGPLNGGYPAGAAYNARDYGRSAST